MCSLEFPDLDKRIHRRFKDRGVVVVGIDPARIMMPGESPATVRMFRAQTGVGFPLGFDDDASYKQFRQGEAISPFPLDVIIDRDGRVVYVSRRYDIEAMAAKIEQLLAGG